MHLAPAAEKDNGPAPTVGGGAVAFSRAAASADARHLTSRPVATSQARVVPPESADLSVLPSGEKETPTTPAVCPRKVRICLPVAASIRWTIPPSLPAATVLPSGAKATQ